MPALINWLGAGAFAVAGVEYLTDDSSLYRYAEFKILCDRSPKRIGASRRIALQNWEFKTKADKSSQHFE